MSKRPRPDEDHRPRPNENHQNITPTQHIIKDMQKIDPQNEAVADAVKQVSGVYDVVTKIVQKAFAFNRGNPDRVEQAWGIYLMEPCKQFRLGGISVTSYADTVENIPRQMKAEYDFATNTFTGEWTVGIDILSTVLHKDEDDKRRATEENTYMLYQAFWKGVKETHAWVQNFNKQWPHGTIPRMHARFNLVNQLIITKDRISAAVTDFAVPRICIDVVKNEDSTLATTPPFGRQRENGPVVLLSDRTAYDISVNMMTHCVRVNWFVCVLDAPTRNLVEHVLATMPNQTKPGTPLGMLLKWTDELSKVGVDNLRWVNQAPIKRCLVAKRCVKAYFRNKMYCPPRAVCLDDYGLWIGSEKEGNYNSDCFRVAIDMCRFFDAYLGMFLHTKSRNVIKNWIKAYMDIDEHVQTKNNGLGLQMPPNLLPKFGIQNQRDYHARLIEALPEYTALKEKAARLKVELTPAGCRTTEWMDDILTSTPETQAPWYSEDRTAEWPNYTPPAERQLNKDLMMVTIYESINMGLLSTKWQNLIGKVLLAYITIEDMMGTTGLNIDNIPRDRRERWQVQTQREYHHTIKRTMEAYNALEQYAESIGIELTPAVLGRVEKIGYFGLISAGDKLHIGNPANVLQPPEIAVRVREVCDTHMMCSHDC